MRFCGGGPGVENSRPRLFSPAPSPPPGWGEEAGTSPGESGVNGKASITICLLVLLGLGHEIMGQAHLVAVGGTGITDADGFLGLFCFLQTRFFFVPQSSPPLSVGFPAGTQAVPRGKSCVR